MGLFRRRHETYNEQLLREAGLAEQQQPAVAPEPPSFEPEPTMMEVAGIPRGRSIGPDPWDACVNVTAAGFEGDGITFVTRPDGNVLVEDEEGDRDVSPFADAVERELRPPYRATAARQTEDLWTVTAKRLDVERIAFDDGDRLELARTEGRDELKVDGGARHGVIPELERLGERVGAEFYVDAVRLDGDLWEVEASPL